MGHVTGEPEDVHGFALTRETERTFESRERKEGNGETKRNAKRNPNENYVTVLSCASSSFFLFV